MGFPSLATRTDVTNSRDVREMMAEVLRKFGRVDVLVNNAGILYVEGKPAVPKLFTELTENQWDKTIDITLRSVLNCTKAVIDTMIGQKSGSIVNIVSDAGRGASGLSATIYGAGKGGIIAFSRHLAYELAGYGIIVNCVSPGLIETTRAAAIKAGAQKSDADIKYFRKVEELLKQVPLGRMGTPQEIANAVAFLASEAASYITGQTLSVNGGRIMP